MKPTKKRRIRRIIMIVVPIVLFSLLAVLLINNHIHNTTRRVGQLTEENYNGEVYDFGDVSVKLGIRGGDSGAWEKNPIYDDDGNMLHCDSVGTIYEPIIYNNSENVVTDWALKIPINEMMWLNNSWNGKMEIHQDVNGEEKVLTIDLRDYSEYDINLDYYIDHSGPMIPLNKGDYFIYYPEEIANEKPIMPSNMGEASARFGYIVYIPEQTVGYVADFSGGEIVYYMYADPSKKVWFWVLIVLIFLWVIWTFISFLVSKKIDRIMKQQIQKEHDEMMVEQTMQIIINIIENKDTSTKGHSLRVAEYSQMIAQRLGYTGDESKQIYYIGLMHDCGKVNIPNSILKNPGKLSEEEYEIMKKHTVYGGDILRKFTSIPDIDVGAKYHHERYDGKGYPAGLVGEEIPMVARIIGVADAFDAMNSKRCYRDKLPKDIIMKELRENREKQFDPKVLDCILSLIEEGKINL